MNAKPIFIVKLPSEMDGKQVADIWDELHDQIKDYHVLVFQTNETKEPEFSVFYEKNFTEVKFDELKDIVKNAIANK